MARKHTGNRQPHAPTPAATRALKVGRPLTPASRDPWAITAPVDETYRYRHSDERYIEQSSTDRYGHFVSWQVRD